MGFKSGAYAKVWDVRPNSKTGKSTSVRISVSRKEEEGKYIEEFSGYATFIATAHKLAAGLKIGDRIKLGDVDVVSSFNRDTGERKTYFKVFSYEPADGPQSAKKAAGNTLDAIADGLPDDFPA